MSAASSELPADRRAPLGPDDPDSVLPDDGDTVSEYMAVDGSDGDMTSVPTEDGGMIVTIGQAYEAPQEEGGFYDNLAEAIPPQALSKLANDLLRRIEMDEEARKKRDEQDEEGIRRTGLGKDAPGGAEFEGASRVVHPALIEACIDYQARVMKEVWPTGGPAKEKIVGTVTREKAARAKRVVEYTNFQLTTLIKEARSTLEENLSQTPLVGAGYIRQYWDHRLKRPSWQFVPRDRIKLPPNAADYYSAKRRTFLDTVSAIEFQQRIEQGLYRNLKLAPPSEAPQQTKPQEATAKIQGVDEQSMNLDGDRDLYEVMSYVEITADMADVLQHEDEGGLYPYLLTIDRTTKQVLAVYRDWEPNDETREPIDHIFEIPFIPWRGGPIGLAHIIGGLSGAATGALRALLDSAQIANMQGGFILKGSGVGSQTKRAQPGDFQEIEGGVEASDIREKVMQFQTKEPSTVLFQLLGFLVEAAKGTIRTSMDDDSIDATSNVPVGTQFSRVEESMVTFSALHGRVHAAMDRILAGLHRLNRMYLPEYMRVDAQGKEIIVYRRDFEGPPSVQPVSDPTIYSDQQRLAQVTAMQQRATQVPGLYKPREVEEWFLKLLRIPDPDRFLVAAPEPHELNAVNENLAMAFGRPVVVFPEQDHLAHIIAHLEFTDSPMLGLNPILAPKFLPAVLQHVAEHMVFHYVAATNDIVSHVAGAKAADLMSADDEVKQAMDKLLALASHSVVPGTTALFQQAAPTIQKAMQALKALQPPQPMDPSLAAVQAAGAETQRKTVDDQRQGALAQAKLQSDAQNQQQKNTLDAQRNAAMFQRNQITQDVAAANEEASLQRTAMETETARSVAAMKVETGRGGNFSDGASLGG